MNKITILSVLLIATLFAAQTTEAQSWQWAISGGTSDNSSGQPQENVLDMATDPNGNIYVLSYVLQAADLNVGGHIKTAWGPSNYLLCSYKSDGTYRWAKSIGDYDGVDNFGCALKTDTLGGVYILSAIPNYNAVKMDTDATIPYGGVERQIFIFKYDTAGTLQWYHWPENDTLTVRTGALRNDLFDMSVDGAGNMYMLLYLTPGLFGDSAYVIDSPGVYLMKYNSAGIFQSATAMAITITGYPPEYLKIKRNERNGRIYITGNLQQIPGYGTLTFGSTLIGNGMFVGCFDSAGSLLWQRQDTAAADINNGFDRLDIDAVGDIYLSGIGGVPDMFNGYVMNNAFSSYTFPLIVKMDSNGNNIWANNAYISGGNVNIATIAVNGNEVDLSSNYGSKFMWPGYADTLNYPFGTYARVFITRFNAATGAVLQLDSVAGNNLELPNAMTADKSGNFYVGGNFYSQMYFSCGDTLTNLGALTNFFFAKYGTNTVSGITSLSPEENTGNVAVYPNPNNGRFILSWHLPAPKSELRITDITGRTVYSETITGADGSEEIDINELSSGMYFYEVVSGNNTSTNGKISVVK